MLKKYKSMAALTALLASAAMALAACTPTASGDGSPIVLDVGDTTAGSAWVTGLGEWSKKVEEATDGRVKINVLPGAQLGGELDLVSQVKQGNLAMAQVGNPGYPEFAALFIPYLFDDANVMEFAKSEIMQAWKDAILEREGVRVLGLQYYPARHITSNNPINSASDLAGVKIRVPEISALVEAFQNFGAVPEALPVTDTYLALQSGRISAEENPLASIESFKFNEVQKYVALTYHAQTFRYLLINESIWQSIGSDDRATIERLFNEMAIDVEKEVRQEDADILARFQAEGITVTEPSIEEFVALTEGVGADVARSAWGEGVLEKIREQFGPGVR